MKRVNRLKCLNQLQKSCHNTNYVQNRGVRVGPAIPSVCAVEQAIGNTPLVYLKSASKRAKCNVWGKCEFMNPGGSIKDRAALSMIKDAEEKGILDEDEPGIVVEGTAGNTGIGLALVASTRNYESIIVLPRTQTQEKKDALRYAGAKLVQVNACPFRSANHYTKIAQRLAEGLAAKSGQRVLYANQWDNLSNKKAHTQTTAPEIWMQTRGRVDAFSCAVGTGGTLAGLAEYMRHVSPSTKICLTDPKGACLYRYFTEGVLSSEGSSISEGIGQSRITGQLEGFTPDMALEIDDKDMLECLWDTQKYDGLMLGLSSGINIAGAVETAKQLGLKSDQHIVTILCDLSMRYATKQYNLPFLQSLGLPCPPWISGPLSMEAVGTGRLLPGDNPLPDDEIFTQCLEDAIQME